MGKPLIMPTLARAAREVIRPNEIRSEPKEEAHLVAKIAGRRSRLSVRKNISEVKRAKTGFLPQVFTGNLFFEHRPEDYEPIFPE